MKRTQIQLDEETHEKLREEAHARRTSMAELIREALRQYLSLDVRSPDGDGFSFVGAGCSDQGELAPVSERHDEALAHVTRHPRS